MPRPSQDALNLAAVAHCMDNFLREENETLEFEVRRYQRLYREASADRDNYAHELSLSYRQLEAFDNDVFRLEGVLMRQVTEISRLRSYLDFFAECLATVARDEVDASPAVVHRLLRLVRSAQLSDVHVDDLSESDDEQSEVIDLTHLTTEEELSSDDE